MYIGDRANRSIVSMKQGVWGAQPPEAIGYLLLFSTKIPYNARLETKFIRFSNFNGAN